MKNIVYIALVVFLGSVAVQGYGPKINRRKPAPHHRPPPGHNPGPPNKHDNWDNRPVWGDRSDSGDSYDSYGPDDYSPERDRYDSSYEDSGSWHDRHHPKHPCKHPHTKKPPKPTNKPTTKPIPTTRPTSTVPPTSRPPITTTKSTTQWETTTNTVPETITPTPGIETTTTEEEFPTISPKMQACLDFCLSTPEYNPVCGSNGQTYDNEGKLFCAAACGVNVTLRRRSVCPPPKWDDYDDGGETTGTATTPPPTTTTTPYIGRTTPMTNIQRCMKQCHVTPSFSPVCGTDLITYMNIDRLKCAQRCGEVVEVLCEKACAACGVNPVTPRTTTTLRTTKTPDIGRTTQGPDIQDCIKGCPVTPEYNPVCGSNRVTYSNPGHLLCAQLCGVAVSVARLGPCGPGTTSTTTTQAPPITRSPGTLNCIRRCPVTSEYNPVCGSDGLTYTNPGNLECAKFCGVAVNLRHKSRCVDEFDLGPDESTTLQTTIAINENKDPVTTPSRNTASTTSVFTSPTTATEKPTTPTTTPTSTKNPDPNSSSTLGFTIPDDVLVDIFGSTTTQVPITKPINPDDDENLDLDTRFNTHTDTHKE